MALGKCKTFIAAAMACSTMPTPATAHAFGARYDLPLPLWLYLSGAGAAVALTFVLLALFANPKHGGSPPTGLALRLLSRLLLGQEVRAICAVVSTLLFALILVTGFLGQQDPIHNLAPTLVWVIWWVGLAFFVALIGNVWPALNPWTAIYDGVLRLKGSAGTGKKKATRPTYLEKLGVWPSVILFAAFAWIELISEAGEQPRMLGFIIVIYSFTTWAGMAMFGRDKWLTSGEVFNQVFAVLGKFAPFGVKDGLVTLRPYGADLFTSKPVHPSMAAFVFLILSTVTFDGFVETPVWAGFLDWLSESRMLRPTLLWAQALGVDVLSTVKTGALLLLPFAFMLIFRAFCIASCAMTEAEVSASKLANTLVLSLVPIAIAYHIAHYLSYLLLAGQLIIPLASDPFGWGWDLFGTASRAMDVGIIDAATVWYVAITAIVLGHVIAVWLSHMMALALYGDARRALLSQIPILILMVLYTMMSLWILSQPIIES